MKKTKQIELTREMGNFREVLENSTKVYKENIAYKYKKDPEAKEIKYIEKTYAQVGKDVKALSTALLEQKFAGKRIAIIGGNRYEWVISYLSITCGGMVVAPMDKLLPETEIMSLIKRSEVSAVIFDKKYLDTFLKLKANPKVTLDTLICMDDIENDEVIKFSDLLEEGRRLVRKGNKKYDKVEIDNDAMSIMLFTSGTTSEAKIVMLSQHNICANMYGYQTHFKILPTDTLLSFLPIHHTFESSITILYGFYCGATIAFCDGLRYIAANLKEYQISVFVAVPLLLETMYKKIKKAVADQGKTKQMEQAIKLSNALLKLHIDVRAKLFKQVRDNFGGKLRIVLYGAAALDKETIIGFNNFGIDSIQGYGLTETSPVIAAESEEKHNPGAAGYPLDNVQVKILNPDKNGLGEIVAKGPNIMLGYYNDEKKTKEAFEDGWFKTGDYGYIDDDGFIFITGRKGDIIVLRNGKNVYPQELEFKLGNQFSYIKESIVFARNESKTDTVLVAKIVYDKEIMDRDFAGKDYEKVIWNDIKEFNKDLPTFKHIKKILITDEPMEKTTTQKIKRTKAIEKAEKELAKKEAEEK